jgi:transcription elongation factor GreA
MSTSISATFLTTAAHAKLVAELAELQDVALPDVVRRIDIARSEGDLKENGGYHAAREEQGKIAGRITQLQNILREAVVGEAGEFDGTAGPGRVVTVRREGQGTDETFLVGSREGVDEATTVYSPQSPIGSAVTGSRAGDDVTFTTPTGKTVSMKVLTVEPFTS